ncbi:hypothetical protein A3G67_04690 [Candidatus Roizmanbacteria bacterium RIFCSPLOWO2_12_FULL_40_12]|uniref:Cell envelope-related transcriptional attenuator domain-containing protein n=1 Tax=Candidatus Roizmanbacteria bacterium RIFCSPLOWO2_01_FULL_40_42 TaxID=1802066 RepID=A0A1F7J4M7_9BACT|nr:MAG: hypothetical protein A2779_04460 [Candidatus Roizmanbacteria bacterium RIFCSPHIGHO2_01_FULL_40_98]OGK27327.1 MAG: hypothetical protein A3C31_04785 [Candidatus Roizmanbacteria bacterium RIFCSPHIGHO2_02_FULL_40_53]OGK30801.1 MAG: hypothetical protein A2W49_02255 [Candidatus Roizmanbacteria bacterium RIFCSPHIGHO2_12_41_18]OGK36432.1 MAG: hypothetical protein A3E69_02410 [Candidatus Roizmanbacteria bacterium RIFCSPHIGHO2_12_FULL_40_130]OGK50560.1 MAG: hypothetical protein A3B50_02140 [Candi
MKGPVSSKKVKIWIIGIAILLFVLIFFGPYYLFLTRDLKISPFQTLFLSGGLRKVNDQVNVLILGIPGGNHDGPLLSDSMIVLNYDFNKRRAVTIGMPRDVWSATLQDRLNSAYAYGEAKKPGGGLTLAKAEVGAVVGMPIQYVVVMNFSEFKDIIDYFGGIDIEVKNSFTDKKFPLEGKESDECNGDAEYRCRYETVHFTQGKQHMDGNTALKFVRSRNAIGKEGSDFARSLRQQAVTEEMKGKIVKTAFTFNLGKIKEMYSILDKSVQRDISNQQAAALGKKLIFDGKFYEKNFGLPRELFTIPDGSDYEGKYVLIPAVSFQNVYDYTHCLLSKEDEVKCSSLVKN